MQSFGCVLIKDCGSIEEHRQCVLAFSQLHTRHNMHGGWCMLVAREAEADERIG
jgi:hypothetical protein